MNNPSLLELDLPNGETVSLGNVSIVNNIGLGEISIPVNVDGDITIRDNSAVHGYRF